MTFLASETASTNGYGICIEKNLRLYNICVQNKKATWTMSRWLLTPYLTLLYLFVAILELLAGYAF